MLQDGVKFPDLQGPRMAQLEAIPHVHDAANAKHEEPEDPHLAQDPHDPKQRKNDPKHMMKIEIERTKVLECFQLRASDSGRSPGVNGWSRHWAPWPTEGRSAWSRSSESPSRCRPQGFGGLRPKRTRWDRCETHTEHPEMTRDRFAGTACFVAAMPPDNILFWYHSVLFRGFKW